MEVILREDVEKLGSRGQLVTVAAGFARNFLLPKRLAVAATDANKKIVEQERQAALRREAKEANEASELAKLIAPVVITIAQKAGENDQLFGSVTSGDIAAKLEELKFHIDKKKIVLHDPIKQLGEYDVTIKLHREVSVDIKVNVVKED